MSDRVQGSNDHTAPVQLKKQKASPAPSCIGQQVHELDLGQQDLTLASLPPSPTTTTTTTSYSNRPSNLLTLYKMDEQMDFDETANLSYDELKNQVRLLQEALRSRDLEIVELRSKLDKFQAVFAFSPTPNLLSPVPAPIVSLKKRTRTRLIGISAEPAPGDSTSAGSLVQEPVRTFPKNEATKKFLEQAIQSNEFMKRLDSM